ncbi:microtubule-associated protein RP/EB family member 1-like [Abrus precatorius]|uniref:Microtubule-associated protein RP/EB family member 1-like n=1 Tax=Abrus precatorius TaxID=3816 RepID=A0A8B8JQF2_ABRPR|nr:microtubule-associated protein RP/EB family member 1-like [Abrus precatorius]
MATKAKETTAIGKEKKAPSSNSHITTTKRTTKPSTTTNNSTKKANSIPIEKNTPNYLKPTLSSRLESPSLKHPKSDTPNKPSPNRRNSLDKPLPSSKLTKQTQPSSSRLQCPRERSLSLGSSIGPINRSTYSSKPISGRTSNTPSEVKAKPLVAKSTKKSTPSTKKVANNNENASAISSKRTSIETSTVESEQVKEVTSQEFEVIKVENEEHIREIEHVTDILLDVDSEHELGHVHGIDNFHPTHDQVDDEERVISTVSEADEAEKEPQEVRENDLEQHELEEENIKQDEGNNNESDQQEVHSSTEGEINVNGNENEDEGEGGMIIIEDHKSENKNNEEAIEEKKEDVESVEEAKVEPTQLRQQLGASRQGSKKESQVSNDVIEETASKLLEARKNKVRALAGAFQTVIDYQTTSK